MSLTNLKFSEKGLIDVTLTKEELLELPNITLPIELPATTHWLAENGWKCRVRRKYRSAKTIRVTFKKDNNTISFSASVENYFNSIMREVEGVFYILEKGQVTSSKNKVKGLHEYKIEDLLSELKRRLPKKKTPVKHKDVNKNNVGVIINFLEHLKKAA